MTGPMSYQYSDDHRDYLQRELATRMRRRPLYSQRAFARDLGLSPSSLTDYLKGRIGFSPGRIVQISQNLGLTPEQREHWKDLVSSEFNRDIEKRKLSLLRAKARLAAEKNALSLEEFKAVSDWHYFAMLELIDMNSLKYSDAKFTSKALGLPIKTVRDSFQTFVNLKLLRINDKEIYEVDFTTKVGDEAPSEALRSFHSQILGKALTAIETQPLNRRYISSSFFSIPKWKVPVIIDELKSLTYKVLEPHVESTKNENRDELYCFSLQFFDLLNHPGDSK